jgi:molybdopterin molybdotransferase
MLPPMDDSAMDGYAIMAADTLGASVNSPKELRVAGESRAGGSIEDQTVCPGTAVRIMTGAPMPKGADAVIQFEETEEKDGDVIIFRQARKFQNYRLAGESLNKGDRVLCRGERLSPADVGLLAGLNRTEVKVYKRPVVSIISTGDELAGLGDDIGFGQIRDINAHLLQAEIKKLGAVPVVLGIARDTLKDVKEIFLKAGKSDVIISTGGVSMGRYDFVRDNYNDLNIEIKFERVKVQPGGPCTFGKKDNRFFFGLPGRPVATQISYIQFVRPALLGLMGTKKIKKPVVKAVLTEDIRIKPGKVHLLRGCFILDNEEFYVSKTGSQKTSVLRSMSDANCLIIIPDNVSKVKAGDKVAIQLIDHEEI